MIAASVANTYPEYAAFRDLLPRDINVYVIQLRASKPMRDERRLSRTKPSTAASRNYVDHVDAEDAALAAADGDYRLLAIHSDDLTIGETVSHIVAAIPAIYLASTVP